MPGNPLSTWVCHFLAHHHVVAPGHWFNHRYWLKEPNEMLWSRPAFTSLYQWSGTGMGVWWTTGSALATTMSLIGTPAMSGKCWCSHVLNVLDL